MTEGSRAVQLDDLSRMKVDINLSQTEVNKVANGMEAIITIDALPGHEFEGYVDSIASYPNKDSEQVEYRVSIALHDPNQLLKPGFSALVNIITAKEENVLMVPRDAIQQNESKAQVIRVNLDGRMETLLVITGVEDATYIQLISEDITAGDILVLVNTGAESPQGEDIMRMMMTINRGGEGPSQRRPNQ